MTGWDVVKDTHLRFRRVLIIYNVFAKFERNKFTAVIFLLSR